jgi:hypothetical protein
MITMDEPDSPTAPKRGRRGLLLIAALLPVAIAASWYWLFAYRPGITVIVFNAGPQPLIDVVLVVTGHRVTLGEIAANRSAQGVVKCTGDSHLEIEFRIEGQAMRRLDAGGYFQPGYYGTIRVTIEDGELKEAVEDINGWSA